MHHSPGGMLHIQFTTNYSFMQSKLDLSLCLQVEFGVPPDIIFLFVAGTVQNSTVTMQWQIANAMFSFYFYGIRIPLQLLKPLDYTSTNHYSYWYFIFNKSIFKPADISLTRSSFDVTTNWSISRLTSTLLNSTVTII